MGAFIGEHGLQDFLVDEADNRDAIVFAAKDLHHFCVDDGRFSGFLVGLKTALQFLTERLVAPTGDAMKLMSVGFVQCAEPPADAEDPQAMDQ